MKSQNKDNKLKFYKSSVADLNNTEMQQINGGTSDALDISSCICPILTDVLTINTH